ncbi:hypothetical protein LE190_01605 [Massilia oculi]|uniref:O-antigen ligase domain-containing protein n=1 Tax=Massilia hydrophila TaxID=3044279 RepID=A0ABS7Y5J6_9BURK|nr:hypothetical protein [Massilia oculi]MCA1854623.1 hypothetical protein [Massilia oculi]
MVKEFRLETIDKAPRKLCFLKQAFFTLALFCYIFNFTLLSVGVSAAVFVLVGCAVALVLKSSYRDHLIHAVAENLVLFLLLVFAGLYGSTLSALMGDGEVVFAGIFFKNVAFFTAAVVLGLRLKSEADSLGSNSPAKGILYVFDLCFYAIFIQGVLVIWTFIDPSMKELLSDLILNRGNIDLDHAFRFRGLHDSGGFTLGVILGLGAVYGMFTFVTKTVENSLLRLFMVIVLFFSTLLVARTGIVVVIIGLVMLLIRWPTVRHLCAYLFLFLFCFIVVIFAKIFFSEQYDFFNDVIFGYAFEFFVNYQSGQGLRTESSDDLKTMLFIPDLFHMFFGSGSYDLPSNGVDRSDSGYMKTLLASGVLGVFIVYGAYASIALRIRNTLRMEKNIPEILGILGIILLVIEIKAPVFYQNDTSRLFWLVYGTVLAYSISAKRTSVHMPADAPRICT